MTKQITKALQNLVTYFHLYRTSTVHSRFIPAGAECFSGRIINRKGRDSFHSGNNCQWRSQIWSRSQMWQGM